jgi:hypothetical protein
MLSVPSAALYLHYGPMLPLCPLPPSTLYSLQPLWPLFHNGPIPPLQPPVPFTASITLLGPLSSLRLSFSSMAFCTLYGRLSPLQPSSVPSMNFRPLCNPPSPLCPSSPLRPFDRSMALYPFPMTSVPFTALCHLFGPLSPLWPSVPSSAPCLLYGPLSPVQDILFLMFHKMMLLLRCITKQILPKRTIL